METTFGIIILIATVIFFRCLWDRLQKTDSIACQKMRQFTQDFNNPFLREARKELTVIEMQAGLWEPTFKTVPDGFYTKRVVVRSMPPAEFFPDITRMEVRPIEYEVLDLDKPIPKYKQELVWTPKLIEAKEQQHVAFLPPHHRGATSAGSR